MYENVRRNTARRKAQGKSGMVRNHVSGLVGVQFPSPAVTTPPAPYLSVTLYHPSI